MKTQKMAEDEPSPYDITETDRRILGIALPEKFYAEFYDKNPSTITQELVAPDFDPIKFINGQLATTSVDDLMGKIRDNIDHADECIMDAILRTEGHNPPTTEAISELPARMEAIAQEIYEAESTANSLIDELNQINASRLHVEALSFSLQICFDFNRLVQTIEVSEQAILANSQLYIPRMKQLTVMYEEIQKYRSIPEVRQAIDSYKRFVIFCKERSLPALVASPSPDTLASPQLSQAGSVGGSQPALSAALSSPLPPLPSPQSPPALLNFGEKDTTAFYERLTLIVGYHVALNIQAEFYPRLCDVFVSSKFNFGDARGSAGCLLNVEKQIASFFEFVKANRDYLSAVEYHVSKLTTRGLDALQAFAARFSENMFEAYTKASTSTDPILFIYPMIVSEFIARVKHAVRKVLKGARTTAPVGAGLSEQADSDLVNAIFKSASACIELEAFVKSADNMGIDTSNTVRMVEFHPIFGPHLSACVQAEIGKLRIYCNEKKSEYANDAAEFAKIMEVGQEMRTPRCITQLLSYINVLLSRVGKLTSGRDMLRISSEVCLVLTEFARFLRNKLSFPNAVFPNVVRYFGRGSPQTHCTDVISIVDRQRQPCYNMTIFSPDNIILTPPTPEVTGTCLGILASALALQADCGALFDRIQSMLDDECRKEISFDVANEAITGLRAVSVLTYCCLIVGDYCVRGVIPTLDPSFEDKKHQKTNFLSAATDAFHDHLDRANKTILGKNTKLANEFCDMILINLFNAAGCFLITIKAPLDRMSKVKDAVVALSASFFSSLDMAGLGRISQRVQAKLELKFTSLVSFLMICDENSAGGGAAPAVSFKSFHSFFEDVSEIEARRWYDDIMTLRFAQKYH